MKKLIATVAATMLVNVALAQVGTATKEAASATSEKAKQVGDQTKAAVSSQPTKTVDNAEAQTHKAKSHAHATTAKDAAKKITK